MIEDDPIFVKYGIYFYGRNCLNCQKHIDPGFLFSDHTYCCCEAGILMSEWCHDKACHRLEYERHPTLYFIPLKKPACPYYVEHIKGDNMSKRITIMNLEEIFGFKNRRQYNLISSDPAKYDLYNPYTFAESGNAFTLTNKHGGYVSHYALSGLILGHISVQEVPFVPSEDELFWFVCADGRIDNDTVRLDRVGIMTIVGVGNCYPSYEEAKSHSQEWVEYYNAVKNKICR